MRKDIYADTRVYINRETKMDMAGPEEWTDGYDKRGDNDPVNLSRCNGGYCGESCLANDSSQVVLVE